MITSFVDPKVMIHPGVEALLLPSPISVECQHASSSGTGLLAPWCNQNRQQNRTHFRNACRAIPVQPLGIRQI